MTTFAFDQNAMQQRKAAYYAFARQMAGRVFKPDGTYQPGTEADSRIAYWIFPALIASPDERERAFANTVLAAAAGWDEWNIFNTSIIATHLVRERAHLTPELVVRAEEHLAQFVDRDGGRTPSSGANDYVFHGYNDNMPAMAVRAMILAGDVLDRSDYTDHGLFNLEGACAHFERRGLLSEYTSGTYTAISLVALADVVECSTNATAREMAAACCDRILLDIFGHWHQHVGGLGGAESRAYTADKQDWLTVMNSLIWYLTGSEFCLNPVEILGSFDKFPGYGHHGHSLGFNLAQFTETLGPAFTGITPAVRDWCATPRQYPYEILATTDAGGGAKAIQTRAWHQPLYGLGTASQTWCDQSGQQLNLHAVLSRSAPPSSWRDRISVWHQLTDGGHDQGDTEPYHDQPAVEVGQVTDVGHYQILQQRGSALVLGAMGPVMLDKEIDQLTFSLLFNTVLDQPDEIVEEGAWQFLGFGEVYVGVRLAGMVDQQPIRPRRQVKNKYLRIELPLVAGPTVSVTPKFREWCVFGYVFEIAAKAECGSFGAFREQCQAATWEYYHGAYRTSRYCGRHGELQIIDSVTAHNTRFMAIDGAVVVPEKLAVTGLDRQLTSLFADGHRVKQRRLMYNPDYIGSPFYDTPTQIIAADLKP